MDNHKLLCIGSIGNLKEYHLRDYFSKYGDIQKCYILRKNTDGISFSQGVLKMADQSIEKILKTPKHSIRGNIVNVYVLPKHPLYGKDSKQIGSAVNQFVNAIEVIGIDRNMREDEVRDIFLKFGELRYFQLLLKDNDTRKLNRGYCFGVFENSESTDNMMMYNGILLFRNSYPNLKVVSIDIITAALFARISNTKGNDFHQGSEVKNESINDSTLGFKCVSNVPLLLIEERQILGGYFNYKLNQVVKNVHLTKKELSHVKFVYKRQVYMDSNSQHLKNRQNKLMDMIGSFALFMASQSRNSNHNNSVHRISMFNIH